jgi:hypothetical protein
MMSGIPLRSCSFFAGIPLRSCSFFAGIPLRSFKFFAGKPGIPLQSCNFFAGIPFDQCFFDAFFEPVNAFFSDLPADGRSPDDDKRRTVGGIQLCSQRRIRGQNGTSNVEAEIRCSLDKVTDYNQ